MNQKLFITISVAIGHLCYAGTDFNLYVINDSDTEYTLTEAGFDCWYSFAPVKVPPHSAPQANVPTLSTQSDASWGYCEDLPRKVVGIQFTPTQLSQLKAHHIVATVEKYRDKYTPTTGLWYIDDMTTLSGSSAIYCPFHDSVVNAKMVINADGGITVPISHDDFTCTQ